MNGHAGPYTGVKRGVPISSLFPFTSPTASRTTIKQDPCPKCRCEEAIIVQGHKICNSCQLTREDAEVVVKHRAQRDTNGNLLCQKCSLPFPYADPKPDGTFVCTPCTTNYQE